jgi:uncharacterized membrane protein YesL
MKNFFRDFLTEILSLLTAFSGIITLASGVAIALQKPGLGLVFTISAVTFACLLALTVKIKGGWATFADLIFPWW